MEEKKKTATIVKIVVILLLCAFIGWIVLSAIVPYTPPNIIICATNVKSLSTCFLVYQMDEKVWPNSKNWCDEIKTYIGYDDNRIFQCMIDKTGPCSYAMNENIPADVNDLPGDLVLLFESAPGWNQTGGSNDVVTDRHGKPGANIAFADGHVEFVTPEDIPSLRWTIEQ